MISQKWVIVDHWNAWRFVIFRALSSVLKVKTRYSPAKMPTEMTNIYLYLRKVLKQKILHCNTFYIRNFDLENDTRMKLTDL